MLTLSVTMMLLVLSSPFQKSGTVTWVFSTPILATAPFGAFSGSRSFSAT